MHTTQITIKATISAPVEQVWTYWTMPEHITRWNFANDEWCCPEASNELKVGGKYLARMEARDGSIGFDFEAIYDEICKPDKIVFTLTDGRKVITEFIEHGELTHATIVFDAETDNSVELQRDGWQAILNNFKRYVESQ